MKNIKVSEVVYDKIEAEKKGDETFDDTLRRMIGLYPNLKKIMAYLSEKRREWGRKVVELIDGLGNFVREIKKNHRRDKDSIVFKDEEEEIEIVSVDVNEEDFDVYYRNKDGDMELLSCGVDIESDYEREKKKMKSKVSGAVRKWGSTD